MAENINISFAPNKSASESQRIADLEQYVSTLTERTKFAFASIIEEYNDTSADDEQTVNMIYQATSESGSDVGQFTNADKNCEIFNDYSENIAQSHFSHAEGSNTSATAPYAHAEGYKTTANAPSAHAEGEGTVASQNAHAEGRNTQATGYASHAEGENTTASGWLSHAEGKNTVANGMYTHAEGENCKAIGSNSHAGGMYSEALSEYSFAHGYGAKSSWTSGTALGRRNKTQNTLFVIGNGDWQEGSESDALTLDENGMLWIEGSFEASAKHGGLGITIHGAARFGNNWNSDGTNILLAVGNGYDSERKSNALSLDQSGNLHIAGKLTADGGIEGGGSGEYTFLKAVDITGQTVDLNAYKLNQLADKGKSLRHFCSVANSENITNRPVSVNEPFELVTTNIRYVSTGAYHTVQKYTSATRQRTYTRWCANSTWSAWKCDTDVVVYGSVTEDSPKTFAYATYGEGFGVVEIEAYYDNATNPVRNRKVFSLSPTASIERVMLTISNGSSESVTLANGSITMSMTGTTALSFMIRYTNSR